MKKISISCEAGRNHDKIGLAIYDYKSEEELEKVVMIVEKSL